MSLASAKEPAAGLVEAFHRAHERAGEIPMADPEYDAAYERQERAYRRMLEELCRHRPDDPSRRGVFLCDALGVSEALAFAIYYMAGHCRDEIAEHDAG